MAAVIDVGQVLDKYELLERVGQGGMAVVYRGMDRSLRRTVAIKVLHRHLAEHQEARDRFAREAHAVAKLRHENILEIFDFSGGDSDQSYIVTEFIDGATLKQFVTDHPPRFAEIGAMVIMQVCRALAHAHSAGVLHRDVKPENVMIRSDGVVKLTDFGISQMVDLQRMTVTGQLLGSPAYMSPEHVEGRPLDFRTDVFAVGIVLYQLTVGRLPFEGKNPHEILKRIAECKFPDPRQADPRVGNELGRIILRAMARDPDDRYADVTEMLTALERYLDGSGLGNAREELGRYFKAPVPYEMALGQRLVDHLVRRARELLGHNQPAALELLDRVLVIEPNHAGVLAMLDGMSRRRRGKVAAIAVAAVLVAGGAAWMGRGLMTSSASPLQAQADDAVDEPPPLAKPVPQVVPPVLVDAAVAAPMTSIDAGAGATQAGAHPPPVDDHAPTPRHDPPVHPGGSHDDGGVPDGGDAPAATFTLAVSPRDSEVRVAGGPWQKLPAGHLDLPVGAAELVVEARNESCCEPSRRVVTSADAGKTGTLALGLLPAQIIPHCAAPDVDVRVDDRPGRLDAPNLITFDDSLTTRRTVIVEFVGKTIDRHKVSVQYKDVVDVACALP